MYKIAEVEYSRCSHITRDPRMCKRARNTGQCFRKLRTTRFIRRKFCVRCRERMIDEVLKALELL